MKSKVVFSTKKKRPKKEEAKPDLYISIDYITYTAETREADPNDEWSRASTQESHIINGYKVHEKIGDFPVLEEYGDLEDKDLFLVSVDYDTGDSFGTDEGRIVFVDLVNNLKDATALANKISEDAWNKDNWNFEFTHPVTGRTVTVSCSSWKGYFESFNSANVHQLSRIYENTRTADNASTQPTNKRRKSKSSNKK